jgi:hypothetical protein
MQLRLRMKAEYCTISFNSDRGVTCDHLSEILLLDKRLVTSNIKQFSDKSQC